MQGTGDLPHYANVTMPFDARLPHPPEANPTGVYRCCFTAGDWSNRRVVLHVGAAESVLLVRVNGQDVKISKGVPTSQRSSTSPRSCGRARTTFS